MAEQLEVVVAPTGARVHWVGANVDPAAAPLKLTVPVGAVLLPLSVSAIVAVHVVVPLTATEAGVQLRVLLVERAVTVTVAVAELGVCEPPG